VILVDTGSTHSFVDQLLAKKMKLPVEERSQLSIMVANREKVPCLGCYVTVTFTLQGKDFQATLHLLTLGGCNMVLGVDWLSTLGPILWDFA
jgi:predicted aspartyl protease